MLKKILFLKIIIPVFALFLISNLLYTQSKGVLAQEEVNCNKIPVGATIDQTEAFAQNIISELEVIITASEMQKELAIGTLIGMVDLTDNTPTGCTINNCRPNCTPQNSATYCGVIPTADCELPSCPACWTSQCGEDEEGNPIFCKYCPFWKCKTSDCSGNACPFNQINNNLTDIIDLKTEIENSSIEIENLIQNDPPEIFANLKTCREKLKICVTPSEQYENPQEELENMLCKCADAKAFDDKIIECHENDFFCCE